jgi:hypothetical protein
MISITNDTMFSRLLHWLPVIIGVAPLLVASPLENAFQKPAVPARSQTYWFWLNGHLGREGITADMEAMAKNRIQGALIFPIAHESPGPVGFMSDEWIELFLHSVREADRVGIQIGLHNGAGWSCSGGPWIDAEHNMQVLTTSRTYAAGDGTEQTLMLPQPWKNLDYYRDAMVIAYPSGVTMAEAKPVISTSGGIDGAPLMDGNPATRISLTPVAADQQRFIQLEFPTPITAEGLWLTHFGSNPGSGAEVQVSDDGVNFRTLGRIDYHLWIHHKSGQSQVTFPPATGRFFRLKFDQAGGEAYQLGEVDLALAPTLNAILPKAGYYTPLSGFRYEAGASRADGPMVPSREVLDLTKSMDSSGQLTWKVPPGGWTVLRVGHTAGGMEAVPAPTGITALECDKLSKTAVKRHYDGFIGRLAKLSGPLAGKAFSYATTDSWEVGAQNWTAAMPEEFHKRRGYDLKTFLPLLLTGRVVDNVETSERFLEDYRRTLQELVLENYYGYYTELCHKDGLQFWSENYHSMFCDTLDIAGKVDVVMGEFWANYIPDLTEHHWLAKHASSCSQVTGQPLVPAEAFTSHLDRWTESPKTLKATGDLMYAGGINQFVFHRYAHQPWLDREPGMTMGPNGIHFERTNTWWNEASAWLNYLERCQSVLQQGSTVGQVVVLVPEYAPASMSAVDARYQWLKKELPRGFDYLFSSQNGLLRKSKIENGSLRFPLGEGYRLVVLPDTTVSTPDLLAKVTELLESGVTVYATQRPNRAAGLVDRANRDREIQELAAGIWGEVDGKNVTSRQVGKGLLVQGIPLAEAIRLAGIKPDFEFANADGSPVEVYQRKGNAQPVNAIHRRTAEADVYFVANHNTQRDQQLLCRFGVTGMVPERWDPVSGKTEKLAAWREADGATEMPLNLGPSESAFIVFRPAKEEDPIISLKHGDEELFPAFLHPDKPTEVARDVVDNFTMAAWVKAGGAIALPTETVAGVGGDPGRYAVYPVPGHEVFGPQDAGAGFMVAANGITVMEHGAGYFANVLVFPTTPGNDWNHVAVVYRDRTPTLYVNGKAVKTGLRGSLLVHPGIGVAHARPIAPFDGEVAGLTCLANALESAEIKTLMQETRGQVAQAEPWKLTMTDKGVPALETSRPGAFSAKTVSGKTWAAKVETLSSPVEVAGPWQVDFESGRGAPASVNFPNLISWSEHADEGIRYFSGHATYHSQFTVPPTLLGANRRLVLDLGGVEVIASVKVNGKDLGILWHAPYDVDVTNVLKAGANDLEIRVVNLWPNRIIGDLRNPNAKPFTYSQTQLYSPTDALLPSGLLGPVQLRAVPDVALTPTP